MKKTILLGILAALLFSQCAKEKDPFLIGDGEIGPLTRTMKMMEVDSIFGNDSIVKLNTIQNSIGTQGEVEVYEKGGKKLLLLSPNSDTDPNSVITNIQVFDDRYKTDKGLNINSTFADVKANYEVEGIQNAINAVVVFLKDTDVYITIDKKELPASLRYNYSAKVEVTQIPDAAKFKYLMIGWDLEDLPDDEAED